MASTPTETAVAPRRKRDTTHLLYIAVIVAVVAGALVGLLAPDFAKGLKPLGDGFVALIKMMIAPVIFCTIVLGIGSIAKAATVGRVGGLALGYFIVMSTFALAIGLVVGNIVHPGEGLNLKNATYAAPAESASTQEFLLGIIPTTLVSSLTSGNILQTLLVALVAGFALQKMGKAGVPILRGIGHIQALVFRILIMVMWLAPIGAFGAIAAVVGATGFKAIVSMFTLMAAFYIACIIFIVVILGGLLKAVTGVNIFKLMKYLAREYLLIFSTSSSEAALPRLIAKMEHLGVSKPVVGVTVPTGYSFNLDGTAIYLTMAALFVASAMGKPLDFGEQISLLVFMVIASKGAAGVSGAGLATLAGGLQAHRPDLVGGVAFIVGIDRFMSEARALTNFTGNAVATVLVGTWVKEIDRAQVDRVLDGHAPFDEATMTTHAELSEAAEARVEAPVAARV
ncbi:cation:dicarboxylase symporter family transporter [Paenarthrobacter sp. DKR-5]|uniref:cation:dicarboxylate symporter family transporter n=1 Tax=Paenarthrobacter sp. DKR-5 TaxID=2835535 RepID=UPI001BDC4C44|nr:cation:dicarboxylase symporter family transporter [Paenarthrobacter sp. DKR-5]MBT1002192.1 cation:dicarboxylase symporter family transporter [Paenarthrobacter sp. DKR-5]